MAERALTEEAMLAGLHDIRLPSDAPGGLGAEILAAVGIGILVALACAALFRLVTQARGTGKGAGPPLPADGSDEAALRRVLLERLKRDSPERYAEIAGDLYRPGGLPDIAALRGMVARR